MTVGTGSHRNPPPLSPDVYADRRMLGPAKATVFDNLGWGIVAEHNGRPIRLWTCAYALRNGTDGPWPFEAAAACQTTLLVGDEGPESDDNDFVHIGWDPEDLLAPEALNISVQDDAAIWDIAGRRFTCSPQRWTVRGTHAGVEVDLTFAPLTEPYWYRTPGDFAPPAELWVNQFATATGHVAAGSERIAINGFGWHEHHTHVRHGLDPLTMNSRDGLLFIAAFGADISIYTHLRRSRDEGHLVVRHGRDVVEFDISSLTVEYGDWWTDPRSWFHVPRSFVVTASGPDGAVKMEVRCKERAYYLWPYRDGAAHQYWYIATAECVLELPDLETPVSADLDAMVNLNRAFHRRSPAGGSS